jgi:hypothetical protein
MNFRNILVNEGQLPSDEDSKRRYIVDPTRDLNEILAHLARYSQENMQEKPGQSTGEDSRHLAKVRFYLNENEEMLRYATQYLHSRYEFDGLMDKFQTTDILDILEQTISLKYTKWEDPSMLSDDLAVGEK